MAEKKTDTRKSGKEGEEVGLVDEEEEERSPTVWVPQREDGCTQRYT